MIFPDYFNYSKKEAIDLLKKELILDHILINITSQFLLDFIAILPKKFGVDKRKLHLSNLIISKRSLENKL